jgi:MinD superfamily P-loop ATPase
MKISKTTKIAKEKATIQFMIRHYCRLKHGLAQPCPDCASLCDYALARLDICRYGEDKPSCKACSTHCYAPARRQAIREVMRYIGPRMVYLGPWEFIRHCL